MKHIHKNNSGFTIVELIVVIAVIGILAGAVIIGYGSWRRTTQIAQVKSDLNGAASAMASAQNFSNSYPTTVPATFTPSSGVTISGGGQYGGSTFCIKATSNGIIYHITNGMTVPAVGSCTTSCFSILNSGASTGSGVYTIDYMGSPLQVYCDMVTSGGGWTLILTNPGPYTSWNLTNIYSLNSSAPSISLPYSILNKADNIKTDISNKLQYRIDAGAFGTWGGVWEAPFSDTFVGTSPVQNATNIEQYGVWTIDVSTDSTQALTNIVPWVGNTTQLLSSWGGTGNWWGTLVTGSSGWGPAPYITPEMTTPGKIWYWVR